MRRGVRVEQSQIALARTSRTNLDTKLDQRVQWVDHCKEVSTCKCHVRVCVYCRRRPLAGNQASQFTSPSLLSGLTVAMMEKLR